MVRRIAMLLAAFTLISRFVPMSVATDQKSAQIVVKLPAESLKRLRALPSDQSSDPLLDFTNVQTGGVRDAIVLLRMRRSSMMPRLDDPPNVPEVQIDSKGNWNPRIVLLRPGERATVRSNCEHSHFLLHLPDRGASGMEQFPIPDGEASPFKLGSVSSIGPYKETKTPILFTDSIAAGPTHRSRCGHIFVTAADYCGVTDADGVYRTHVIGDVELCIWHDKLGWMREFTIAGRQHDSTSEWLNITAGSKVEVWVKESPSKELQPSQKTGVE